VSRLNEYRQREADSYSRRRKLMDRDQKRAFDTYYGKQDAAGTMGGKGRSHAAGKGDARRPQNTLLFDIGWEISFNHDLSDEERAELEAMWHRVKRMEEYDD